MMGMVEKRRMASATAGRATSSPLNGRRRNDGQALSCRRNVWSERRKGRKRQPGADSSDRPALTSTPTVERRRHRRRRWPTHDTTTPRRRRRWRRARRPCRRRPRRRPMQEYFFWLASWHRHDGGGTVCVGRQAGGRPSLLPASIRISFCTPTHDVCFGIVSWISRSRDTSIAWCFVRE